MRGYVTRSTSYAWPQIHFFQIPNLSRTLSTKTNISLSTLMSKETVNPDFLEQEMTEEYKRKVKQQALENNPGYDEAKLNSMSDWDVRRFEKPQLPAALGKIKQQEAFSKNTGICVLDMALRMPDQGWKIPKELEQFREVIGKAVEHERAVNPEFDDSYYVYITVDQRKIRPQKSQRRYGHHTDAYVTKETKDLESGKKVIVDNTYVITDNLPTEFQPGPFPFHLNGIDPEDCTSVLKFFDEQSKGIKPVLFAPYELLRMTPFDVHTPTVNNSGETLERTFVKVQFSKDKYNLIGNTINNNFDYDNWHWVPRDPNVRNHRNSITGWNRTDKDNFYLVTANNLDFSKEQLEAQEWTNGKFFHVRKTESVTAKRATAGDVLYTSHGFEVMTVNKANEGDWKITTSKGDQYFLSDDKFRKFYEQNPESEDIYLPKQELRKALEVTKPVRMKASWGAWQYAPEGSIIICDGESDMWIVHRDNYKESYEKAGKFTESEIERRAQRGLKTKD